MGKFPRINILGVGISATNLQRAFGEIDRGTVSGLAHDVNVCTVHTLVWLSRLYGYREVGYTPGAGARNSRHY